MSSQMLSLELPIHAISVLEYHCILCKSGGFYFSMLLHRSFTWTSTPLSFLLSVCIDCLRSGGEYRVSLQGTGCGRVLLPFGDVKMEESSTYAGWWVVHSNNQALAEAGHSLSPSQQHTFSMLSKSWNEETPAGVLSSVFIDMYWLKSSPE